MTNVKAYRHQRHLTVRISQKSLCCINRNYLPHSDLFTIIISESDMHRQFTVMIIGLKNQMQTITSGYLKVLGGGNNDSQLNRQSANSQLLIESKAIFQQQKGTV